MACSAPLDFSKECHQLETVFQCLSLLGISKHPEFFFMAVVKHMAEVV